MKSMETFELVVIGGGPSGYASAMRAIDLGIKVCLIEKDKLGGAGVFNGALASKTLWEISKDVMRMRATDRRFSTGEIGEVDFKRISAITVNVLSIKLPIKYSFA